MCEQAGGPSFRPAIDTDRFFDWASTAPNSSACLAAMSEFADAAASHHCPPDFLTASTDALSALRDRIRTVFGAEPDVDVALVRSVAEASSVLARALVLPPGSSVVVSAADHPALVAPWCWLTGVRPDIDLRTIACTGSGVLDLDHAVRLIDSTTAVVACSHLTHLDGVLQPVEELTALTRHRSGALVIIDGAQSAGRVPVRFDALGADVFLASARKALLGPLGTGFVLMRSRVRHTVRPVVFSSRNALAGVRHDGSWRPGLRCRSGAAVFEGNLPDLRALSGLSASLRAYQEAGPDQMAGECRARAESLASLAGQAGYRSLRRPPGGLTGITRLSSPRVADHRRIKADLASRGFAVAADREWLRISVHAFSTEEGIAALCDHMSAYGTPPSIRARTA
ncbi:cysteine desulfurase [Actinomadura luteofluorescens]|uniref:aminotransferase class V-fold PLP-dependent enzyme n=1 Tax=Actinomadura luteofluorescens TaxID=46163 RepID=UPI002164240E|nr:aminotransferase class V-fold PLP-dependent enzyme [Actinomadura glauciflava]MCR3742639.1 cysteine sulfinate desulfinase [Actinomadura glauciflava]